MKELIATSVETQKWNSIIDSLRKDRWKVTAEYKQFDKGIDFDLYELSKNGEKIIFAWDNWFEGEIRGSEENMRELERRFGEEFKFGEPEHLSGNLMKKMKAWLGKK